jgi:hypothetical protein
VFQIVFNEISAAELSALDTLEQLELLEEFKVGKEDLANLSGERFGKNRPRRRGFVSFSGKGISILF